MERLDIAAPPVDSDIEAAIHFARYAIARSLVSGKRVLDFACGEGYGSHLLKEAGAAHVVGADVSEESVAKADKMFGRVGLEFKQLDAAKIGEIFRDGEFDVVISVETIEHLKDPEAFLSELKRITKPTGIIVISCPNDHWYYPEPTDSNPYHLRKYTFAEFKTMCTSVLGENVEWTAGTGAFGYCSAPLDVRRGFEQVPGSWMEFIESSSAYIVKAAGPLSFDSGQSSYFVGIWNAPESSYGVSVFPLAMDDYARLYQAHRGEFERLQREWETREEYARSVEAQRDQLVAAGESLRVHRDALDVSLEEARKRSEVLVARVSELEAARDLIASDNHQLREVLSEKDVALSVLRNECKQKSESLDRAKLEFDRLWGIVEGLKSELVSSERKNRVAGLKYAAAVAESQVIKQEMHVLRGTSHEISARIAEKELGVGQQAEPIRSLQVTYDTLVRQLAELQARYDVASIGHYRYTRLRGLLPSFVLPLARRMIGPFRGRGRG